jgi:hypothetical protein
VIAEYYGLARPTSDVDIIQVRGAGISYERLENLVVGFAFGDVPPDCRHLRRVAVGHTAQVERAATAPQVHMIVCEP